MMPLLQAASLMTAGMPSRHLHPVVAPILPARARALVVDDLPVNRLILSRVLGKLGFDVLEAENGLQCIDVYTQERTNITCIFLDLQMPVCDGYATTRALRQLEAQGGRRVPVVVCTASCLDEMVGNQTVAQRALSLGADGAVKKPLCLSAVQQILDDYAPGWRSAVAATPTASPAATAAAAPSTNPDAAAAAAAAPSPPRQLAAPVPKHEQQQAGHHRQQLLQQQQLPPQAACYLPDARSGPHPHVLQPHASTESTPPRSPSPVSISHRGGELFGSGFPLSVYSASEPGLARPAACTSPDADSALGSSCFMSSNGSGGNSKPQSSSSHTFQVLLGFSDSYVEAHPLARHCHPLLPAAPVVATSHHHHPHGHSQLGQQQQPHSHALPTHNPCHQPPRASRPAMSRRMSCDFSAVALLVQQAVQQPLSQPPQQQQACGSSPSRMPMPIPPFPTAVARC